MPKVRLQKELMNIKRESEAAFQIREEFVRWDNVKTAHDLMDDMEVARMLLDCYDLVGGNFLIWSDQAKLAPPPLYATLRLQHVTSEGFEVLQEIKALGAWKRDTAELSQRKSKRKQTHVRRIAQVQVKKEVETDDDEDFISDDDDDYMPEDEIIPQRVIKSPRSARGRKAKKPVASSTRALEAPESGNNDGGHGTSSKPAARKRGRPRKGEVRPPPPKRGRKRKPKPEEEMDEYKPKKTFTRRTRKLYQCNTCQNLSDCKKDFHQHFKSSHMDLPKKEGDVLENATVVWRCIPCDKMFSEADINPHRNKVHNFSWHVSQVCDICGVLCESYNQWRTHTMKHAAEKTGKRLVCKLCNRPFIFMKDLKKHLRSHSKDRPHVCEVCGKSFKALSVMKKHMLVHSEIKPLTCEYCGKGFKDNYNLKGHVRTHTGEKPFRCDVCEAAFTHNVSLKTHKRSAHGIDMWKDQKPQNLKEFDHITLQDPNSMYTQYQVKKLSDEEAAAKLQQTQPSQKSGVVGSSQDCSRSKAGGSSQDSNRHSAQKAHESLQIKREISKEGELPEAVKEIVKSEDIESSSYDTPVTVPIRPLAPPPMVQGNPNYQPNPDFAPYQANVNSPVPIFNYQGSYMHL